MISEFKIHKSSMLYDNKTGVIFEKPYNEFAQAHLQLVEKPLANGRSRPF